MTPRLAFPSTTSKEKHGDSNVPPCTCKLGDIVMLVFEHLATRVQRLFFDFDSEVSRALLGTTFEAPCTVPLLHIFQASQRDRDCQDRRMSELDSDLPATFAFKEQNLVLFPQILPSRGRFRTSGSQAGNEAWTCFQILDRQEITKTAFSPNDAQRRTEI